MLKWLWLSVVVIALDQATKLWVDATMQLHATIDILPVFELTYVRNTGASWSLLAHAGGWQRWLFVSIAASASAGMVYWLKQLPNERNWEAAAWALVLGGAIGNLIDRLAYGYVIDFLGVFYHDWHFPYFNVADSAITVGVGYLLVDALILANRRAE